MKKLLLSLWIIVSMLRCLGQWGPLNSGTNSWLSSITFLNKDTGYVVGTNGRILQTYDAGESWNIITSVTSNNLNKILFVNKDVGFIIGESGTFLKTINGGNTWINKTFQQSHLYDISVSPDQTVFVVGAGNKVYKTIDGGTSWISYILSGSSFFTCHFSTSKGFVGAIGKLFYTLDACATWTPSSPGQYYQLMDNFFVNDSVGYLLEVRSYKSYLRKTFDRGITWSDTTKIASTPIGRIFFLNENEGYAVGDDYSTNPSRGRIYKTANGGINWSQQDPYTSSNLSDIYFTDAYTGYACGAGGVIIKTINGGVGIKAPYPQNPPIKVLIVPEEKGVFRVDGVTGNFLIEVYEITGKKIAEFQNDNILDLNKFTEGIYLLRIFEDAKVMNFKVIKR